MIYPDTGLMGKSITFDCNIQGQMWKHFADLSAVDGSSGKIDEYWSPLITTNY